jgi:hypothetical protein
MSNLFIELCGESASRLMLLSWKYKLWDTISLLFWNATSVNKTHVDVRDRDWCIILPFGQYSGGAIDLPYINAKVHAQRGDICFLRSNYVYHNVDDYSGDRQSLVATNHNAVLKRFNL